MAIRKTIISFIDFWRFPFLEFIPTVTFRYLFCGVSTILVDWVVFYIGYHFIFTSPIPFVMDLPFGFGHVDFIQRDTLAFLAAFIAGFIWGFGLNKYVVFTTSSLKGRVQLFRYSLIVATCILFNLLLMKLFIRGLDWFPTIARVAASLIVAVYSYLIQRRFTFKS